MSRERILVPVSYVVATALTAVASLTVFCITPGARWTLLVTGVLGFLILRRHPRIAAALALVPVLGTIVPAMKPPVTDEGLVARLWVENLSTLGGAYSVIWSAGSDAVVTTHAHTNALSGATVFGAGGAPAFEPMATRGALWGTAYPGGVLVHEMPDGTRIQRGGPWGTSVSHFYDLASSSWSSRREDRKYRWSRWVPQTRTLVVIEQTSPAPTLHGFDPDVFAAGGPPRWSYAVPIFSLEEAQPDPQDPAVLYCRGDAGLGTIAKVDTRTGEITFGYTGVPWAWSVEPDRWSPVLYVSHPWANQIDVVDRQTMQVVRSFEAGGMPRSVAHLANLGLLAVGQYMGHQVAFFAPEGGWREVASLPACARVRAVSYDAQARLLYYADACGAHRVHIPAGWNPREPGGGLTLALNRDSNRG